MSSTTTHFEFELPTEGGDDDAWGGMLNDNWVKADSELFKVNDRINNIDAGKVDNVALLAQILTLVYPVGSLFFTTSNINPGTYLDGTTWARKAQGRAIVGVGTAEGTSWTLNETKGLAEVILTAAQLPAHDHTVNIPTTELDTSALDVTHTHDVGPLSGTGNSSTYNHKHDIALNTETGGKHAHKTVNNASSGTSSGPNTVIAGTSAGVREDLVWDNLGNQINPWGEDSGDQLNTANWWSDGATAKDYGDGHIHAISGKTEQDSHSHTVTISIAKTTSTGYRDRHKHTVTVNIPGFKTGSTGKANAHSNIQPSIAVFIWERTA